MRRVDVDETGLLSGPDPQSERVEGVGDIT
jgi:hypothetical protein